MPLVWQRALKRSCPVDRQGGDSWEEMGICHFLDLFRLFTYRECGEVGTKHNHLSATVTHNQVPVGGAVEL